MIVLHVVSSFLLSSYNPPLALANLLVLALLEFPSFAGSPAASIKSSLAMMAPLVIAAKETSLSTFYLCALSLHLTAAWFRMYHSASAKDTNLLQNGLVRSLVWLAAYSSLVWVLALHYGFIHTSALIGEAVTQALDLAFYLQLAVWTLDLGKAASYIVSLEKPKTN